MGTALAWATVGAMAGWALGYAGYTSSLRGKVPWAGLEAETIAARSRHVNLKGRRAGLHRDLVADDFCSPEARQLFEAADKPDTGDSSLRAIRVARAEVIDYGDYLRGPLADAVWDDERRTLAWGPLRARHRILAEAGMAAAGAGAGLVALSAAGGAGWRGLVTAGVCGAILWAAGAGDVVTHTSSPLKLLAGAAAVAGVILGLYGSAGAAPVVYGAASLVVLELAWLVLGAAMGRSVGGPSDSVGLAMVIMTGGVLYHGIRGALGGLLWTMAIGGVWALVRWTAQLITNKERTSYIPLLAVMPGGLAGILLYL